ncbi:HPt (histidine-containing phosphotransfer) domain-containing protein [Rhodopseudomonas julia]|uniref:HPt (Histidine-containing phosphotransfer) domain-containing protein n=1 Tax=Rhodopseudomonas julia TaxID=200617 RepID=A0ABU0C8D7_9BRAD|nr:Hpt domain-containing protein [Rhodopseudomonas julia]MDQ0326790.1 HPt (histidine-containing phosphotransfer) domain-containing protein [Rhodopseudomonas julia]
MAEEAAIFNEAHLDRQTMHNEALKVEILALFVTEADRLLNQIKEAKTSSARGERVHALKGLARNVGAERLALAASLTEERLKAQGCDLAPLEAAVQEVVRYLART